MQTRALLALVFAAVTVTTVDAQTADSIPVYPNLGDYARKVTTLAPRAQLYFDQGMRLTYGYGRRDGMRSFRHAANIDPQCAMCWWGVAWAYGPYINGGMDSVSGVAAYDAARRAVALKSRASEIERAMIDAMATRYAAVPKRVERAKLDSAYANAMRDVYRRFPTDQEAATLLGEALMVLRPWDQWTRNGDPQPGTPEVIKVLEEALSRDLMHPGACHQYIHAVEALNQPERAERCAEHLGGRIPGASHVPHMPSHIYMRIGRYADGVRANQEAWIADQRSAYDGAPGIYTVHNLDMLHYAAAYDGQGAVSVQAAKDLVKFSPNQRWAPWVALVRFGRWDEILELNAPPTAKFQEGVWRMARGLAHLSKSQTDSAQYNLQKVDSLLAATTDSERFGNHKHRDLLGIGRAILAGEVMAAAHDFDGAVKALETALPLEDSLSYDEPEPWIVPVRHVLGAVLLEAGRPADAERRYREDLRKHPRNLWALYGLEKALRAQNKTADADTAKREFDAATVRADTWILGSRQPPRPAKAGAPAGHH